MTRYVKRLHQLIATRNQFGCHLVRSINLSLCTTVLLLTGSAAWSANGSNLPNIVLILLDDLGSGEMQWYPEKWSIAGKQADATEAIQTPNLYQLARQGVRFTNYRSPAPSCSPARAAMLTGRYPQELGIRDYFPLHSGRGIYPGTETIASLLRERAGYRTGHFGKWHLGYAYPERLPANLGFDESFVRYGNELFAGYKGSEFIIGDDFDGRAVVAPDEHSAETITRQAIRFVEDAETDGVPYFLNLWYRAPHNPLDPPGDFPNIISSGWNPVPYSDWPQTWAERVADIPELADMAYLQNHSDTAQAKQRAMYIATMAWLDYQIGKLVERIDALDPEGNTLIIVTSDNGAPARGYAGGSGVSPPQWQPNGDLVGKKLQLFEGGIKVPFLVRWSARSLVAGGQEQVLSTGYDLLPTFLDAAGVDVVGEGFVGNSVLSVILNGSPAGSASQPVVWENKGESGPSWSYPDLSLTLDDEQNRYAVLSGADRRKLVVSRAGEQDVPLRLFDTQIKTDHGINENFQSHPALELAASEPKMVDTLEVDYRQWRQMVGHVDHEYNKSATTATVGNSCLEFGATNEVASVRRDQLLLPREGDFSFQTEVRLQEPPLAGGSVIAQHKNSWSLAVHPTVHSDTVRVGLTLTGKLENNEFYPGQPGDKLALEGEVVCGEPCEFNVGFAVLGQTAAESSVRLYLNGEVVDEYRADNEDDIHLLEIWANETGSVLIGNNGARDAGIVGDLVLPRFYTLYLTPQEIAANQMEQSAEPCDSGCHP